MKHLLIDYNMFLENKINKVIKDIEILELFLIILHLIKWESKKRRLKSLEGIHN